MIPTVEHGTRSATHPQCDEPWNNGHGKRWLVRATKTLGSLLIVTTITMYLAMWIRWQSQDSQHGVFGVFGGIHGYLWGQHSGLGPRKLLTVDVSTPVPELAIQPYMEQEMLSLDPIEEIKRLGATIDELGDANNSSDNKPLKVLLVTYFRGGSTFLGEVLNQNPSAFYTFEPLAAPVFAYKDTHGGQDYQIDTKNKVISRSRELVDELASVIHDVLDCDVDHLDRRVLAHYFNTKWPKSKKLMDYKKCIQGLSRLNGGNVSDRIVSSCTHHWKRNCDESDVRVAKVIRLMLYEVEHFIKTERDTKIIYYIRDPRGTLLSRWNVMFRNYTPSKVSVKMAHDMALLLCARMQSDFKAFSRLKASSPGQYFILKYEDLAEHMLYSLERIYRFLGIGVPRNVVMWMDSATHAQKTDGQVGAKRLNSTTEAEKWHKILPGYVQEIINNNCMYVLRKMNYPIKVK